MFKTSLLTVAFALTLSVPGLANAEAFNMPTHSGTFGHHRRTMTMVRPTRRTLVKETERYAGVTGDAYARQTRKLNERARIRRAKRQQKMLDEAVEAQEEQEAEDATTYRNIFPGRRIRYGGPQNVTRSKHLYFDQIPERGY